MSDLNRVSSLGADFVEDVTELIQAVGYTLTEADNWLIDFCVQKIEQEIKNFCNVSVVPDGLYQVAVGLVAAEFLTAKRASGNLDVEALTLDVPVKGVKEGDTDITFATDTVLSGEQRLNVFLASCNAGREQFLRFRRLAW